MVVINQVDRRPPRCPLAQGCQRRCPQFHFARRSHCDVAKIHIDEYLGALVKIEKEIISFVMSVIFEYFSQICREFLTFIQTGRTAHIFDHISLSSSYNEKCFRQKSYGKPKHTFWVQYFFFWKSWLLWNNVGKYCTAGQATDDNMAHAGYLKL